MKGARHLSKEEIQNLTQSFYGEYEVRNRTLFLLGLNIGTRISELLALNVGDVWQYGKPVAILELRKAITKGKKTRQIPLNEQAREVITELIGWKESQGEDLSPHAPLFASRQGNKRLSRFRVHQILKESFQSSECSGKVSTHSLRKSFAKALLTGGNNLRAIQILLGHASLATTERYLQVSPEELNRAVSSLSFAA
ncbi:MAG: tyrosine-type recombinase/integrase [Thermodesulfobacteriota bacterium]|jgi:integrase/recombinase XerD|nr:MAG: tyrosine-type recombinase/integrase [Thermodesulfobacteriota bacterium]